MTPAKPYKPKDKTKAKAGALLVEQWIMAKLRRQTFFSLAELNHCVSTLLTKLNQKPFKQIPGSRQQWFETLAQPVLSLSPKYTDIKAARVNIDYHLIYGQHLYQAPYHCVGEQVELHAGDKLVEVNFHNKCTSSMSKNIYLDMPTEPRHMPEQHA